MYFECYIIVDSGVYQSMGDIVYRVEFNLGEIWKILQREIFQVGVIIVNQVIKSD